MTSFLLIRHAVCDPVGNSLAGRTPGVLLNDRGRAQARTLGQQLAELRLAAVYSSPLERAQETAQAIATLHGLTVHLLDDFTEVDFGTWTGRTLRELEPESEWKWFNQFRTGSRIPGGETILEVLARAWGSLETLRQRHGDDLVAVVSHGDVLRTVLAFGLGIPLDHMLRIELAPGSVSILELHSHGARVLMLNGLAEWPHGYPLPPGQ